MVVLNIIASSIDFLSISTSEIEEKWFFFHNDYAEYVVWKGLKLRVKNRICLLTCYISIH